MQDTDTFDLYFRQPVQTEECYPADVDLVPRKIEVRASSDQDAINKARALLQSRAIEDPIANGLPKIKCIGLSLRQGDRIVDTNLK